MLPSQDKFFAKINPGKKAFWLPTLIMMGPQLGLSILKKETTVVISYLNPSWLRNID